MREGDDLRPRQANRPEAIVPNVRAIMLLAFMDQEAIAQLLGISRADANDLKEQAEFDFWALKIMTDQARRGEG